MQHTLENPTMSKLSKKITSEAVRHRRRWLKPGALVTVGTGGPVVEVMSFETPDRTIMARMIPGQATTLREVPASALHRMGMKEFDRTTERIYQSIKRVRCERLMDHGGFCGHALPCSFHEPTDAQIAAQQADEELEARGA